MNNFYQHKLWNKSPETGSQSQEMHEMTDASELLPSTEDQIAHAQDKFQQVETRFSSMAPEYKNNFQKRLDEYGIPHTREAFNDQAKKRYGEQVDTMYEKLLSNITQKIYGN